MTANTRTRRVEGRAMDWGLIARNILSRSVLEGVTVTIALSVLAQALGSLLGLGLYFARRSRLIFLRRFADGYIWFFRGTPLIVQIVVVWQILPFIPYLGGTSVANALDYGVDITKLFNLANPYFLSG